MKKVKALRLVNALLAIDFILIVTTAITKYTWFDLGIYTMVHAIPGFIFAGLILCHVLLNREWIKKNYFKSRKE